MSQKYNLHRKNCREEVIIGVTQICFIRNKPWAERTCFNYLFFYIVSIHAQAHTELRRKATYQLLVPIPCVRRAGWVDHNLVHSTLAHLWFQRRASLIRRQRFMAGLGFSEACRGRRMWITAQCSSTVLSRWLHLFWQALDCVWWWETAQGWCLAPALQLTMWIMETRRSKSMHQQTPTPINPSLKGSLQRPPTYLTATRAAFERWLIHDGGSGPKCSTDVRFSI